MNYIGNDCSPISNVLSPVQLKLCKGISYAAVAAHADKNNRRKLAAMLIEHEPRPSKQVGMALQFIFVLVLRLVPSSAFSSLTRLLDSVSFISILVYFKIVAYVLIRKFIQVPLLLSIGEEDTALIKATESGDTDLVYLVLFHIWQKVFHFWYIVCGFLSFG